MTILNLRSSASTPNKNLNGNTSSGIETVSLKDEQVNSAGSTSLDLFELNAALQEVVKETHLPHENDGKRRSRYVARQRARKHKRRRRRKSMKPEGEAQPIPKRRQRTRKHKRHRRKLTGSDGQSDSPLQPEGMWEKLIPKPSFEAMKSTCSNMFATSTSSLEAMKQEVIRMKEELPVAASNKEFEMLDTFVQILGFVISMAYSNTLEQAIVHTSAILAQHFNGRRLKELLSSLEKMLILPESDISYSAVFRKLESASLTLGETPIGKFLFNVFTIMVVHGTSVSKKLPEGTLNDMCRKIEKDIYQRCTTSTYLETMLEIVEYVALFLDHLKTGAPLGNFLFPSCLHTEVVELLDLTTRIMEGDEDASTATDAIEVQKRLTEISSRLKISIECKATPPRNVVVYTGYYRQVLLMIHKIEDYQRNASFRKAPIGIFLYGDSQIGKSTFYPMIINAIGVANGVRYKETEIASLSEFAKYDDAVKKNTKILKMDDVGATKMTNQAPSDTAIGKIIGIIQSIPTSTNQSSVEKKDCIYHREDAVIGSSNSNDLGILESFKHPEAAFNRLHIYRVMVHPDYRTDDGKLDFDKVSRETVDGIPPEAHYFYPQEWKKVEGGGFACQERPEERMLTAEFIAHVTKITRKHVSHQEFLFKNQKTVMKTELCGECGNPKFRYCKCAGAVFQPKALLELKAEAVIDEVVFGYLDEIALNVFQNTMRLLGSIVGSRISTLLQQKSLSLVCIVLRTLLVAFWRLDYFVVRLLTMIMVFAVWMITPTMWQHWWMCTLVGLLLSAMTFIAFLGYGNSVRFVIEEATVASIVTRSNRSILAGGVLLMTAIGSMRLVASLFKKTDLARRVELSVPAMIPNRVIDYTYTPAIESEGNLSPASMEEIQDRKSAHSDWTREHHAKIVCEEKARTMTSDQFASVIERNLYRMKVRTGVGVESCNLLFLDDLTAVTSRHVFARCKEPRGEIVLERGNVRYSPTVQFSWSPGTQKESDLVFLQLTSCGSMNSLTWALSDIRRDGLSKLLMRRKDTGFVHQQIRPLYEMVDTNSPDVPDRGLTYLSSPPTRPGDCGGVIISDTYPVQLVGLHCAGNGTGNSMGSPISKKEYQEFNALLQRKLQPEGDDLPLPTGSGMYPDISPYGEQTLKWTDEVDPRSCVAHYENVEACGIFPRGNSVDQRVKGFSEIMYSPLRYPLEKRGVEIKYGKPKMNSNRDHAACFEAKMGAMGTIEPGLLKRAILDWTIPLIQKLREVAWPNTRPLTLFEALNGLPNNQFVNAIDETKAAGFGKPGKKIELIDVTYDPITGAKILRAKVQLEEKFFQGMEKAKSGQRLNPVVKSSVKDESVKVDEDGNPTKFNRIFFTMPTDNLCISKALFAPILDVMGSFPLISECAAGVNVTRDDWGQIYDHLTAFGTERIMEGDYSKWDVRLSGQLIRAAGMCCIEIARALGYSPEELRAMAAVTSDIATSYVLYNGTLVLMDGWMPSGSYMTLAFNSICNSLLHRCAYYSPGYEGSFMPSVNDFRSQVHLITMGDDSLAGCKTDNFSMVDMAEYCRTLGIKYTCGDKSEVDRHFISAKEMTFCKRQWYYSEELKEWLAPLSLDSIMKSLYMAKATYGANVNEILIQQVDAALRELARHPPDVFETYRSIIEGAVREIGLAEHIRTLSRTYKDWMFDLNQRYFVNEAVAQPLFVLEL